MREFWVEHVDAVIVGVSVAFAAAVLVVLREALTRAAQAAWAWLVATVHGQGARFRGRYLAAIVERHGRLKLIGIYNQGDLHPPRLREVFISLRVAAGQDDGPKMGWNEALDARQKRVVILGSPGTGKTTLLDYLVLVLAGEVEHPLRAAVGDPVPLVARLRELGTPGREDLMSLLRASVPLTEVPDWHPKRWLRKGVCAVLLDGLDEVLDEERHARAVEEIKRLCLEFPDNYFVITCRLAGWHNQLSDVDFRTFEVQELEADDIRKFLGVWYREVLRAKDVSLLGARPRKDQFQAVEERARKEAAERSGDLWSALAKNESLLRISRIPLLLSLITLVHYHRRTDLPEGRAALYEDCLRILLEQWDKTDKGLQIAGPTLKEKLMVLKAIAFHYLENDILEADLPALEGVVLPLLPKIKVPVEADALVRQIEERSGVLVELALGRYGFAHRALHDALAADWIVEHARDDLLLSHSGEERWREVILIAAGRAPAARARALVGALLESDAKGFEGGTALQVAGLALAEDVQLGDDLRGQVRQRLVERLSREEAAGAFGRLAGALLAGDPEAARDWLKKTLSGDRNPLRRKKLLNLLPALGEEHARPFLPLLGRLVGDSTADPVSRGDAALALARIGIAPEAEVWDALRAARDQSDVRLKAVATWAWCDLGRFMDLRLVRVPAGEFLMGSKPDNGEPNEQPQYTLYLPTYYLGKFPVTVQDYLEYLVESGREIRDLTGFEKANQAAGHPVVDVSWYDALAYARWHGTSLPSEAEWEKAGRGTEGRVYPWGNEWQTGRSNSEITFNLYNFLRRRWVGTTPVGRYSPVGDSPYGCADMVGNVWEWTRSLVGPYPYEPGDGREDLEVSAGRVLRGGAFGSLPRIARCSVRGGREPHYRSDAIGFRVVVPSFSP